MKDDLIERKDLTVDLIDENPLNTNKMNSRQFDLLVDNIQTRGLTENIVVRPVGDRYRIVSGHWRFKASLFLGYTQVPCAIIRDPNFSEEMEEFQLVRMNMIRGQQDPQAFLTLYSKHAGKYGDDLLQELFGFSDEAEFKRLITQTAKALPKDMQAKFKEAAKEVKTIDGLAQLLNHMFTNYGDTLKHGYMIVDFGGKDSIWLRMEPKTKSAVLLIGEFCAENDRTMDDIVGGMLRAFAAGDLPELAEQLLAKSPPVAIEGLNVLPTKENLKAVSDLKE